MVHRGPAVLVIVAAVAVVAYAASLGGTFHYDDLPTIVHNQAVRDPGNLGAFFTDPGMFSGEPGNRMYRPVLLTTYMANYVLARYQPTFWHLTNVLLHALCACLVMVLARRLLLLFKRPAGGPAPMLAGLVFAIHPVHTETVNFISARSGIIATAGFLGALLLHLAWTRGERTVLARASLMVGSLACFALGLGGKELAVALVPTILALELLDPDGGRFLSRLKHALFRVAPAAALLIGYLVLRERLLGMAVADLSNRFFRVPGREDPFWGGGRSVVENLLTQSRVFWTYVRLLFVPVDLTLDRYVEVSRSVSEPAVLASLAGLLVLLGTVVWAAFKRPLLALAAMVFLFGLAPTSTLIPLNVIMNEHRLYLPGIGFAILAGIALAALLRRLPRAGPVLLVALGVIALTLVTLRNLEWTDPYSLWASNLERSPRSFRARNQLGVLEYRSAQNLGLTPAALPYLERAIHHYENGARIYPEWYVIRLNLGLARQFRARLLNRDEDFADATVHFKKCIELRPGATSLRRDLAVLYAFWGKAEEAHARFGEIGEATGTTAEGKEDEVFGEMLPKLQRDPRAHMAYAKLLALRGPEAREKAEALRRRAIELGYPAEEE